MVALPFLKSAGKGSRNLMAGFRMMVAGILRLCADQFLHCMPAGLGMGMSFPFLLPAGQGPGHRVAGIAMQVTGAFLLLADQGPNRFSRIAGVGVLMSGVRHLAVFIQDRLSFLLPAGQRINLSLAPAAVRMGMSGILLQAAGKLPVFRIAAVGMRMSGILLQTADEFLPGLVAFLPVSMSLSFLLAADQRIRHRIAGVGMPVTFLFLQFAFQNLFCCIAIVRMRMRSLFAEAAGQLPVLVIAPLVMGVIIGVFPDAADQFSFIIIAGIGMPMHLECLLPGTGFRRDRIRFRNLTDQNRLGGRILHLRRISGRIGQRERRERGKKQDSGKQTGQHASAPVRVSPLSCLFHPSFLPNRWKNLSFQFIICKLTPLNYITNEEIFQ